jgi:NarL family two-component system response regulator YdfI
VISVFIVAASPDARARVETLLRGRNVEIAGSADGIDALASQWLDAEADVILVDASGEQSKAAVDSLIASELASEAAIVVLTDRSEPGWIAEILKEGVRAVLPDNLPPQQLVAALEVAAAGLIVMHPEELSAAFPAARPASSKLPELAEELTSRESEVLQMLGSGLSNKEIAVRLAISEHTVKFHVASILGKLGAGSRTEAVSIGIRRGLVLL